MYIVFTAVYGEMGNDYHEMGADTISLVTASLDEALAEEPDYEQDGQIVQIENGQATKVALWYRNSWMDAETRERVETAERTAAREKAYAEYAQARGEYDKACAQLRRIPQETAAIKRLRQKIARWEANGYPDGKTFEQQAAKLVALEVQLQRSIDTVNVDEQERKRDQAEARMRANRRWY